MFSLANVYFLIGDTLTTNRGMWNFEVAPPIENGIRSRVTEFPVSTFCATAGAGVDSDNNNKVGDEYAKYYHFNMYDHSPDVIERPGTRVSSVRRKEAAMKLPAPIGKDGVLNVLGDNSDSSYPIFRRPSPTDPGMTVATGVFDLNAGTWEVFLDNPKYTKSWIPLFSAV